MSSWQLLDEKEETDFHKSRLLNVEEKPFKRITKRLVQLNTLVSSKARQAPTPPPEARASANGTADADATPPSTDSSADFGQIKEDITLDFAAFDSSTVRLQFLQSANARERERYAADKVRILEASQTVRDSTARLRTRLEGARATLAQRKRFDELAERITSNRLLRPRADQQANLAKLEEECAQLEAESEAYAATWRERRDQFARIMDESMRLRRLIRDEQEEVERREGMDEDGTAEGEVEGSQTPRPGLTSGNATPRPESGSATARVGTSLLAVEVIDGANTPQQASTGGGRTPARESPGPAGDRQDGLKPRPDASGRFSRNGSMAPSREASPNRIGSARLNGREDGEDIEMDDTARPADSPMGENTQENDTPRIRVGSQDVGGDQMDTT